MYSGAGDIWRPGSRARQGRQKVGGGQMHTASLSPTCSILRNTFQKYFLHIHFMAIIVPGLQIFEGQGGEEGRTPRYDFFLGLQYFSDKAEGDFNTFCWNQCKFPHNMILEHF